MKQEIKDIAYELLVRTTPAQGAAWYSEVDWVQVFTVGLVFLQILYLLRKWWREETEAGIKMKNLLGIKNASNSEEDIN